ncbi:hypothetical protein [Turicibacter sanguinis]|uniref:hypothetical protein n=1 Tax=Turicibacter sanguinis TaxID=154288 RepID=UPI00294270E5|nr:hypothetical protein [Turicibacter sanguinis]
MNAINIGLLLCLLWACHKWFFYWCTTRGLLYYILEEHNELLDEEDTRQLAVLVGKQLIKELLGLI